MASANVEVSPFKEVIDTPYASNKFRVTTRITATTIEEVFKPTVDAANREATSDTIQPVNGDGSMSTADTTKNEAISDTTASVGGKGSTLINDPATAVPAISNAKIIKIMHLFPDCVKLGALPCGDIVVFFPNEKSFKDATYKPNTTRCFGGINLFFRVLQESDVGAGIMNIPVVDLKPSAVVKKKEVGASWKEKLTTRCVVM